LRGTGNEGSRKKTFYKERKVQSPRIIVFIIWIFCFISFDYEDAGYQAAELVKMDILLNGNIVEELVTVVHK
jgi:hypothetical protein